MPPVTPPAFQTRVGDARPSKNMKPTIPFVRRSQRVIRMVGELHRMGYQHLRIAPYMHPLAWRLAVGPLDRFTGANGASLTDEALDGLPIYSAADGGASYFDWTDARTDDARALAEKFVSRFSDVTARGLGRDWAYAGWLSELIGFIEGGDLLPVMSWDCIRGTPGDLRYLPIWRIGGDNVQSVGYETVGFDTVPGPDVLQFPLPPAAEVSTPGGRP